MADQEFLASYAVDIDEEGIERLQSVLEQDRSLAASVSEAFQKAYGDLTSFVRQAVSSIPSLSTFASAQQAATESVSQAEQAIAALTAAYAGLSAAIPDESLDLTVTGISGERNESGRKNSEFSSWLSDISGSLNRLVQLTAGSDNDSDNGSGARAGVGLGGETELSLNLAGASESLQGFLESMASSEAEIQTRLNLSEAEEELAGLETEIAGSEAALPLRLDRTRADATLLDLKRIIGEPADLKADASGVISAANSALNTIKSTYANTTLSLKASVSVEGGDVPGDSGDSGEAAESGGSSATSSEAGSESPLVSALMSSTGGRFTRPTKVEVAEDSDTEYIIPVEKESTAVPLIRQMLAELSDSAKESVLGPVPDIVSEASDGRSETPEAKADISPSGPARAEEAPRAQETDRIPQLTSIVNVGAPEIPDIQIPDIEVPKADIRIPDIEVPKAEIQAPDIQVPEISAPDVSLPEISSGDVILPDITVNAPESVSERFGIQEEIYPSADVDELAALPGLILDAFASLSAILSGIPAVTEEVSVTNTDNRTVEAPMNITVNASGSDAEMIGQTIYNSAQRYLMKTLSGALA